MTDALVHGKKTVVLGDRAYIRNDRNLKAERREEEPVWAMLFKCKKGEALPAEHLVLNRILADVATLHRTHSKNNWNVGSVSKMNQEKQKVKVYIVRNLESFPWS